MYDKLKEIETFMKTYNHVIFQKNMLLDIQKRLNQGDNMGMDCSLVFGEDKYSLSDLSDMTNEELLTNFEEEMKMFVAFLVSKKESAMDALLARITINDSADTEKIPAITKETPLNEPLSSIEAYIGNYSSGEIVDPSAVYDDLFDKVKNLSLADIHQVFRRYVDEDKMTIVHKASCHKCQSGFTKVYDKVPKNLICQDCNEDIVNIELQYRYV